MRRLVHFFQAPRPVGFLFFCVQSIHAIPLPFTSTFRFIRPVRSIDMLTVIFSVPFSVLLVVAFFVFIFVFDLLDALLDPSPAPLLAGAPYFSSLHVVLEGMENEGAADSPGSGTGADYVPYDLKGSDRALVLAQQNAGNISYLKQRVDENDGLRQRVDDLKASLDGIQAQINGLAQAQAEYAQEIAGSSPPTITGTDMVEDADEDAAA